MENLIRLSIAVGVFTVMVTWEYLSPRRKQRIGRSQRWPVNLGLAVFNMVLMRLSIGSLAYAAALSAGEYRYGLLNWLQAPEPAAIAVTLLTLDFAIYGQHIVMHKIPLLWRLHKIHHSDLEFDATTAVRFHPLEIVLSMLYKALCISLLGAHPIAVIAFEVILNAAATFNHSNVAMPVAIDTMLRWLLITPDLHRIHHSSDPSETDSNYGFSISWWDRLCGTYTAQPKLPQTELVIGLKPYRDQAGLNFNRLLLIPFERSDK